MLSMESTMLRLGEWRPMSFQHSVGHDQDASAMRSLDDFVLLRPVHSFPRSVRHDSWFLYFVVMLLVDVLERVSGDDGELRQAVVRRLGDQVIPRTDQRPIVPCPLSVNVSWVHEAVVNPAFLTLQVRLVQLQVWWFIWLHLWVPGFVAQPNIGFDDFCLSPNILHWVIPFSCRNSIK